MRREYGILCDNMKTNILKASGKKMSAKSIAKKVAKKSSGVSKKMTRKMIRAFNEIAVDMSHNPEKFAPRMFAMWNETTENINAAIQAIVQHTRVELSLEVREALVSPYDLLNINCYIGLADNLKMDLEREYMQTTLKTYTAWKNFFMVVSWRPNIDKEVLNIAMEALEIVHARVVQIFIGDVKAVLTPEWLYNFDLLKRALEKIAKGLAQ